MIGSFLPADVATRRARTGVRSREHGPEGRGKRGFGDLPARHPAGVGRRGSGEPGLAGCGAARRGGLPGAVRRRM